MVQPDHISAPQSQTIDALIDEALGAHQAGQLPQALAIYQAVLAREPDHANALAFTGIIQCQMGNIEEGVQVLERAIAINPDHLDAQFNLAHAYKTIGRLDDAASTFRRVIALKPDIPDAHRQLITVLEKQGKSIEAERALREVLLANPKKDHIFNDLMRRHIENGHLDEALETCEQYFAAFPWNMFALALKSFVLNECGNIDSAKALLDYNRLLKVMRPVAAPGYDDTTSLNEDLRQYVLAHPTLTSEQDNKSTQAGSQTASLQADTAAPMVALFHLIEAAIVEYSETVAQQPPHPFLMPMPARFTLDIWATVLPGQGHQLPHFHQGGWLSGVYYVALPDTMNATNDMSGADQPQAGWIEFGRPNEKFGFKADPLIHTVQPEEGLMVVFPSYFYHRTLPFDINAGMADNQKRISIAFDAVPQN